MKIFILIFMINVLSVDSYVKKPASNLIQETMDGLKETLRNNQNEIVYQFAMEPFYSILMSPSDAQIRNLITNYRCNANRGQQNGEIIKGYCRFRMGNKNHVFYRVDMKQDFAKGKTTWRINKFEKPGKKG